MERFEDLTLIDSVKRMPGMDLPVRTVVARLNGARVMVSPGSMLREEQLLAAGPVSDLVANNGFHNAGMAQARRLFPEARAWGVPGSKHPLVLSEESWPHRDELPLVMVDGMPRVNEAVFIHRKSRTLICADLCFNMVEAKGLGAWIVLNMFGTYRRLGVSRFFLKLVKDKPAFERSLGRLFGHDFDNVLMGHGQAVVGGGRQKLLQAFAERDLQPS